MARKRWSAKTAITPELLKFRERKKWQIALRRYVMEKNSCFAYAPFFGLDIETIRKWFEIQFLPDLTWNDFGKKWQFEHVIPVTYFDFSNETELKLCWNFTNLRVGQLQKTKGGQNPLNMVSAKRYFKSLYERAQYAPCIKLLEKIEAIESSEIINIENLQAFLVTNNNYIITLESYAAFDFEIINSGRDIAKVKNEMEFLKKFDK